MNDIRQLLLTIVIEPKMQNAQSLEAITNNLGGWDVMACICIRHTATVPVYAGLTAITLLANLFSCSMAECDDLLTSHHFYQM